MIWISWKMDLLHVAQWDNDKCPFNEVEDQEDSDVQSDHESLMPSGLKTLQRGGMPEPGQRAQYIQLQESIDDSEEWGWNISRFDGKDNSFDFTAWDSYDDEAVSRMTKNSREVYMMIRLDVVQGLTNVEIAAKYGKSIRWADTHCAKVRKVMSKRVEDILRDRKKERQLEAPTPDDGEG